MEPVKIAVWVLRIGDSRESEHPGQPASYTHNQRMSIGIILTITRNLQPAGSYFLTHQHDAIVAFDSSTP